MTPEKFVKEFGILKDDLVSGYFADDNNGMSRIQELRRAGLSSKQIDIVNKIFESGLADALYTVLLGLDGCATIGAEQYGYVLKDEKDNLIAGNGELESYAWEEFHVSKNR